MDKQIIQNSKNLPTECGIYKITNLINNQIYVGASHNIYNRCNRHHNSDYCNPNNQCYNNKLYTAMRQFGITNFYIEVIELCQQEELFDKEIYWIEYYDSYNNGYNSTKGGLNIADCLIVSEEIKQKRKDTLIQSKKLQSENHPRAKLTNEQVLLIRQRYINGESCEQIYEGYKDKYKNFETFKNIILGVSYKAVGNIPTKQDVRYTNAKFTSQQIKEIRLKYAQGNITYQQLANEYGVGMQTIACIITRQTYKHID